MVTALDPAAVRVPVLLVHGGQDRVAPSSHRRWLAGRVPSAELWLRPEDGHVAVLSSEGEGLDEPGLSNDSSW